MVTEQCVSTYTIQWLIGLLIYNAFLSLILVIFAILTRKILYEDFKDTKKINFLCFLVVFTGTTILFYWYLARIIHADTILVHTLLQFGNYAVILECHVFIFAPKLFPIVMKRLVGGKGYGTLYSCCYNSYN